MLCHGLLRLCVTLLLVSLATRPAVAHDPSTFCLTPQQHKHAAGSSPATTTTLHQSSTSTEWTFATTEIVYTVTKQVPDHTITSHTIKSSTETVDYVETHTTTHWDGTRTETRARPTITITLPLTLPPGATVDAHQDRDAQPTDAAAIVPKAEGPDTVVCNTIFYSTGTLTLSEVTAVVNHGKPSRTITFVQTHAEVKTIFRTPPAEIHTKTSKHLFRTYTTTFTVVTSGMPSPTKHP